MAITSVSSSAKVSSSASGGNYRSAFAMVTTLFFMWGFLTSLNDILIPHLKAVFDLDYTKALLVQFAFFSAYAAFGVPSGKIVEWIGYQRTMVLGLFTMGLGAVLFVPAASVPSFPLFLTALIILAAGITALQVAANPYVSILGPPQTASSRLNLTQAFNSLGTTVGPPLGGWLILRGVGKALTNVNSLSPHALQAYRAQQASTVKAPYIAITIALIVMGLAIAFYRFPRIDTTRNFRPTQSGGKTISIWRYRHVVLGAVGIGLYCGAEVAVGSFLINYFNQPNIAGISIAAGANLVPFYWGGAMVGRFIGSWAMQRFSPTKLLGICAILAGTMVILSMATTGYFAVGTILLVGLFNSIMFPTIFTLGIAEMGPLTGEASGLLITAIVGAAIIPEIQAVLADHIGLHHAFIIPVLCYVFIIYYAFHGSKIVEPAVQ